MENFITTNNNGQHVLDWSQIEYWANGSDPIDDGELRDKIWAVIDKEGREGNHTWVLKIPPEMKPTYFMPDVYIPEWQFLTALDLIASVYGEWAEVHCDDANYDYFDTDRLRANLSDNKAYFYPYDYRRWRKVDNTSIGVNFAYTDEDLDGNSSEDFADYEPRLFVGNDTPDCSVLMAVMRGASKDILEWPVVCFYNEHLDGDDIRPMEMLWEDCNTFLERHPEVKAWAVENGYTGLE